MTNFDFDTRNTQNQQQNTDGQPTQTMPEQQGTQASQPAQQYYAPPTQPAQPVPDSFNGPVAAKSNTKLGGKVIGVVAGISLLCGLVGGVGGAFAVNALSGSNEPQMSQQGGPSKAARDRWAASPAMAIPRMAMARWVSLRAGRAAKAALMASPIPMAIPVASPTAPAPASPVVRTPAAAIPTPTIRTPLPADRICHAKWERAAFSSSR